MFYNRLFYKSPKIYVAYNIHNGHIHLTSSVLVEKETRLVLATHPVNLPTYSESEQILLELGFKVGEVFINPNTSNKIKCYSALVEEIKNKEFISLPSPYIPPVVTKFPSQCGIALFSPFTGVLKQRVDLFLNAYTAYSMLGLSLNKETERLYEENKFYPVADLGDGETLWSGLYSNVKHSILNLSEKEWNDYAK